MGLLLSLASRFSFPQILLIQTDSSEPPLSQRACGPARAPVKQSRVLGMKILSSGRSIDGLMEKVLSVNILSSDYFKEVYKFKTYHEVIDEIYHHVNHVEAWMTGNCRGPSSAFCLLYKFFTMKLTIKQMHGFLKHPDSTYIRVLMFLQLTVVEDGTSVETSRHLLEY